MLAGPLLFYHFRLICSTKYRFLFSNSSTFIFQTKVITRYHLCLKKIKIIFADYLLRFSKYLFLWFFFDFLDPFDLFFFQVLLFFTEVSLLCSILSLGSPNFMFFMSYLKILHQ